MFSNIFIKRPKMAMVISIVLTLLGCVCLYSLPIEQYPQITPPQIQISANYRGASASVVANTVGAPIEEVVNGVDGMIYMNSSSGNDGSYTLTVTFAIDVDPDIALVKVQNRLEQATPKLPSEVKAEGIIVESRFSSTLGFIGLLSPKGTYSDLELTDYAHSNIKNRLKRIRGMGDVQIFGSKYSIRIWLDPVRMASMGLTVGDVADSIKSQNKQASIGSIGSVPGNTDGPLTYTLTTKGRLSEIDEFENIVVRTTSQGGIVKLRDIARIELGAESYLNTSEVNGGPAAMMLLTQSNNSNAINLMNKTKAEMAEIGKNLPEDMELQVSYDSTEYVRETIKEIVLTLFMTFLLVVLVCFVFLQDWKVTLVPVLAIPVSILATFIALSVFGFTINILSLFGLVLVIGTVVDDAIIVVERVLFVKNRDKCGAAEATLKAMGDITGPMVATTLVFLAIFVPVATMAGITGQIYRQFAITIAVSVTFSLVVAMTLSPALCSLLLNNVHMATKGPLKWFDDGLKVVIEKYVVIAVWFAKRKFVTVLTMVGLFFAAYWLTVTTPTEFIPDEDQGVVFASVQLPEGATKVRTQEVMGQLMPMIRDIPGIRLSMNIDGYNLMGGAGENVSSIILPLEPWGERKGNGRDLDTIVAKVRKAASNFPEANINVFTPPAIQGIGLASGLDMRLQSRFENDPEKLEQILHEFLAKANQAPEFLYAFSSYTANTPHLFLDINRDKAELLGVSVGSIFSTLQTYFGSAYINDINLGTQVNRVMLQSEYSYRNETDSIGNIYVGNTRGEDVPVQALTSIKRILAPRTIDRYNLFPAAAVTIIMKPGYSTSQGIERVKELAKTLPEGYGYEWSGLTYQEQEAAGQTTILIIIALVLAYLFLVAQYESWTVPIPVLLFLPTAFLGAIMGIKLMGLTLSTYAQLGILLLIGLAAKNAILVVEFAKEQREVMGVPLIQAAGEAIRERFRSVAMTAFTCLMGMLPMLSASGAGAASRKAVGSTIFYGMLIATVVGILIIPALYVLIEGTREKISGIDYTKKEAEVNADEEN